MSVSDKIAILFFVITGLVILRTIYMYLLCNRKTTGKLVAVDERDDNGSHRKYYVPIYSYEVNGKVYERRGREYSRYAEMYEINSECSVRYNPADPGMCIIKGKVGFIGWGLLTLIAGLILWFV